MFHHPEDFLEEILVSPIYDMECRNCGTREEVFVHHSERDLMKCPKCHQYMVTIPAPIARMSKQWEGSKENA